MNNKFRFHDLQHCFASWNRQGVDLDTLADLMGHKDTRMTWRYAHIGPAYLASASSKLEKSYGEISTNLAQSKEKELPETGNSLNMIGVPKGIRTPVIAVKGRCPGPG